jgi:signal peptidase I
LSSSQLVFLTSLVAVLRGFYGFQFSKNTKKSLAWVFLLVFGFVFFFWFGKLFKSEGSILSYFSFDYLRQMIHDNMGTFVFVVIFIGLLLFFFYSLFVEWESHFLKGVFEWFDPFILAGTIAILLITYVARTYYIPSASMEPTLMVHDYIVVAKPFILRLFHDFPPKRGDIVVFHPPIPGETREYIKRVIGLPGEVLAVHDGKVFINGKPLYEPYIESPPDYTFGPVKIPPNHYIVLGDNRTNSEDSHAWPDVGGTPFLSLHRIEGRAVLVFFPPSRIGILHDYRYFQSKGRLQGRERLLVSSLENIVS